MISDKMIRIDESLSLIDKMAKTPKTPFLKDKILIGSAKYYLQSIIGCCLDIANDIIVSERFKAPKDYADSFAVLEEEGIVPESLGEKLQQMAKFRNRLVHLYGEIDDKYVYNFMQTDVEDIREFQKLILRRAIKEGRVLYEA